MIVHLKDQRLALGLSQQELAEALGVHSRTVAAWEQGRQTPPLYAELALCELARRLKRRKGIALIYETDPVTGERFLVQTVSK